MWRRLRTPAIACLGATIAVLVSGGESWAIDSRRAPSAAAQRALQVLQSGVPSAPAGAPGPAPLAAGRNVLVNNPAIDTPERTTQNETTLAVHGATVCAGYNNSGGVNTSVSGYSRSTDGGTTWPLQGVVGSLHFGDPALIVHQRTGTFFYADLAFIGDRSPTGSLRSIIAVNRSPNGCITFPNTSSGSPDTAAANVCAAPIERACRSCTRNADCDSRRGAGDGICTAPDVQDKPWIAADNSGGPRDGSVYVCWSRFVDVNRGVPTRGEIRFSRSSDGGVSFADMQAISPSTDQFPIGCHVHVGPNGEVYVVWADRDAAAGFPIRFRRSFDGGESWDDVVQVNTLPIRTPGSDRVRECGTGRVCAIAVPNTMETLNGDVRMAPQAWMAVDTTGGPFTGTLYVAWATDPPGPVDNSDVFLSHSADGGLTWSPEVQIGGGTATDQFEPFVAVGRAGTMTIAWYDRRNDPENYLIDVYATFSRDGGTTLDPLVRVTDESFPVPPLTGQPMSDGNFDPITSACYMGEYIAVAADAESFYYAWGDNRNRVVSSNYPTGRPDPDVFFDRLSVPPLAASCAGDCNNDHEVATDELLGLVRIALGNAGISECVPGDANRDGRIAIDEILAAADSAAHECAAPGQPVASRLR